MQVGRAIALGVLVVCAVRHAMRSRSRVYAVERVPVVGDGNCLFRALAHPDGDHAAVRRLVAAHLDAHWGEYAPFVEAEDRETYRDLAARDGTWGDELCLRAYSDAARVRVRVHEARPPHALRCEYGTRFPDARRVLYDGAHYDAMSLG